MDWDQEEPVELSPKSLQKADQHRGVMREKGRSCESDLDESGGEYQDEAFVDGETALDEHSEEEVLSSDLHQCIVLITFANHQGGKGSGTGILISADVVLTCAHNVRSK